MEDTLKFLCSSKVLIDNICETKEDEVDRKLPGEVLGKHCGLG